MTAVANTDDKMSYLLYADNVEFETWTDWVNDPAQSPTANDLSNASNYSNYVLKISCNLFNTDSSSSMNNACGFRHSEHGAILIESRAADAGQIQSNDDPTLVTSNTYAFTKDEWATVNTSTSVFETDFVSNYVGNTSQADPFFQFFYCGGSVDHNFNCYKYQRATGEDGNPRFDTDSTSVVGIWKIGATISEINVDTLTGALGCIQLALFSLAASMLALSSF